MGKKTAIKITFFNQVSKADVARGTLEGDDKDTDFSTGLNERKAMVTVAETQYEHMDRSSTV